MKKVLVLCGSNSCRSQMAEGYLRFYAGGYSKVESAGVRKGEVHPLAIEVMEEDSIDVSRQLSKTFKEFKGQHFDYVITLCEEAQNNLPKFIRFDHHLHFDVPDPALAQGAKDERLIAFRDVREFVKKQMLHLIGSRLIEEPASMS